MGYDRFADPSQREADDRDSELDAIHDFVQITVKSLNDSGDNTVGFNELLYAGIAHAYQGEFGGGKESVGCDQENDQEHPEQHEGDHEWPILAFPGPAAIFNQSTGPVELELFRVDFVLFSPLRARVTNLDFLAFFLWISGSNEE